MKKIAGNAEIIRLCTCFKESVLKREKKSREKRIFYSLYAFCFLLFRAIFDKISIKVKKHRKKEELK